MSPTEPRIRPRIVKWRAYQFAADPESAVTIASSGTSSDSSQTIRIGLTGSAASIDCSSSTDHQVATLRSMVSRQPRSGLGSRYASIALSVALASPTRLISVG